MNALEYHGSNARQGTRITQNSHNNSPAILALLTSEVEFQRELNQPRVIARRDDAAEIAGVNDLTSV